MQNRRAARILSVNPLAIPEGGGLSLQGYQAGPEIAEKKLANIIRPSGLCPRLDLPP